MGTLRIDKSGPLFFTIPAGSTDEEKGTIVESVTFGIGQPARLLAWSGRFDRPSEQSRQ